MAAQQPDGSYNCAAPKPGYRQALLTCYVGLEQLHQIEWIPPHVQLKAQVRVGRDDRIWVVEEIY